MRMLPITFLALVALAGCAQSPDPYYGSYPSDNSCANAGVGGALVGAAGGGLLGNQFGHGTGKSVATGAGVVAGGVTGYAAGRSLAGC